MKDLLLLNESKLIGALLADMLRKLFPESRVRFATGYLEASRHYPGQDFGFVLADLELAGVGEHALVEHLQMVYPNARLAFLSHKGQSDPSIHHLTEMGHIYLSKETPYRDLLYSLRNILQSPVAIKPRINDKALDPSQARNHPDSK